MKLSGKIGKFSVPIYVLLFFCILVIGITSTKVAEAEEKIRFSYWGQTIEVEMVKGFIADFEKENPNIKVEIDVIPWDQYSNKLFTAFAGGVAPDVIRAGVEWIPSFITKGIYEPLDEYITGPDGIDASDIYATLWSATRYQGKTYLIPEGPVSWCLYYNKDIFDEEGVPYPDNTWTWNTLRDVSKKLTKDIDGDGQVDRYGFQIAADEVNFFFFLWQNGGEVWNEDRTEARFNSLAGVEALQFWQDLLYKDKSVPFVDFAGGIGSDKAFMIGKVAMIIWGSWGRSVIKDEAPEMNYGIAALPYKENRATGYWGAYVGINSASKYKDSAWKWVKYFTSNRAQIEVTKLGAVLPSSKSITKEIGYDPYLQPFLDQISYGRSEHIVPNYFEVIEPVGQAIQKVMIQQEDPKKTLDEAAAKCNKLLQEKF